MHLSWHRVRALQAHGECYKSHCLGNWEGAYPNFTPGSGSNTCGKPPTSCTHVLKLLCIDQRSTEPTLAMALLQPPAPHVAPAAQAAQLIPSASPFAFAVTALAAPAADAYLPANISASDAAHALARGT